MKSARRRARELVIQGLYQWILTSAPSGEIDGQLRDAHGFEKADQALLDTLLHQVIDNADALNNQIATSIDRPLNQLSPVEHAILMMATYELQFMPQTPYRVIINEAVELTKLYGGSDGYKYVNGVLDKLAGAIRPTEFQRPLKKK